MVPISTAGLHTDGGGDFFGIVNRWRVKQIACEPHPSRTGVGGMPWDP